MEFHLESGLRLHTSPQHKNLYSWAINEVDAQGQSVGRDQIPWGRTLYFTAISCTLGDSLEIRTTTDVGATASPDVVSCQVIRMTLRPGRPGDEGDYFRTTTFSMFGTNRAIQTLQLNVYEVADASEPESCRAWGSVSYTSEIDFREETQDDCIVFYLFVRSETFARYSTKIASGTVDEIIFSVGGVFGFYSEWSPSISTRSIKVLTGGREQKVDAPPGLDFEAPRLGKVGEATLQINRRLDFAKANPGTETVDREVLGERVFTEGVSGNSLDVHIVTKLASLRRPMWLCVALLLLIFVAVLSKA